MGMERNNAYLSMILAMGGMMGEEAMSITGRGEPSSSKKLEPSKSIEPTPFHKQEGIAKMIVEYKKILLGNSKIGIIKQERVLVKIKSYLKLGGLREEHLN